MTRAWIGALAVLATTGCVPLVAPADHLDTLPASAAAEQSETHLDAGCCFWPALNASRTLVPEGNEHLMVDLGGQIAPTNGSFGAGLWVRSPPGEKAGFGGRIGAYGGVGDAMGFVPWEMPYGGGTLHAQLAGTSWDERRRWAATIGGGYAVPLGPDEYWVEDITVEHEDGTTSEGGTGVPVPNGWAEVEGRIELGESGSQAFTAGLGVRMSMWGAVVPRASIGLRL